MVRLCTDHLVAEHKDIETVLSHLERFVETAGANSPWTSAQRDEFAGILRFITRCMASHIEKEHNILFPALEDFLPKNEGPLEVLRGEHVTMESQASRLQELAGYLAHGASAPSTQQDFVRTAKAIVRVCRDHIYKEERILFPMVGRLLPAEVDAALFLKMQNVQADGCSRRAAGLPE